MKAAAVRRVLGLAGGVALVGLGAVELAISRSDYDSPKLRPFCSAGLCADQFTRERAFELSQKAAAGDPHGELDDFKRAVILSPASAYRWADLSEAEFNLRDYDQAEYAIARALQLGPRSPAILVRAANVEFQIGNAQAVLKDLAALLSDPMVSAYYDTAFLTYSRLGLPIDQILQTVPQRTDVLSKLLTFLTRVNKVDEAVSTWQWASERSLTDNQSTSDFFSFLIGAGRQQTAQQLWQQYAGKLEPAYRKSNYIYNAGFESAPLPSPFDWAIESRTSAEAERVREGPKEGSWAVRIRFNGEENTDYQQTYQDMVLEAGHYKFSGLIKAQQITTDEGLRFHIFDQPTQAKLNVWTETVTGNQDWKKMEADVNVPAGVKVVRVQVARQPSIKFDNKIGGTAWVAQLQLSRQ